MEKRWKNQRRRSKDRKKTRIYGGETTNSEPLKEWTDKYYRQDSDGERGEERDGAAVERRGLIEIILTSSSNLFRGKHASDS